MRRLLFLLLLSVVGVATGFADTSPGRSALSHGIRHFVFSQLLEAAHARNAGTLVLAETDGMPGGISGRASGPALGAKAGATLHGEPALAEKNTEELAARRPVAPPPEIELPEREAVESVLAHNDIVAYYGQPHSEYMGILGEYPLPEAARRVTELAQEYDRLNGERDVLPGFHLIYGTIYKEGDVGILDEETLLRYIRYAKQENLIVILDHQLGTYDVVESVKSMLPYLRHENVHLAIDPEWATDQPGERIGSVTAKEINDAQRTVSRYLKEQGIKREVLFVVHQFNWRMIQNREDVRSDFDRVALIHNADGFGPPQDKYRTWEYLTQAENMPLKGFKLFYPKSWREGGYDAPLMEPQEVLSLRPRPVLIQYQ
jgi:hypothetical protein